MYPVPADSIASESLASKPMKYRQLAIANSDNLRFGHALKLLVTRQGLRIGDGLVYPELNFTLPAMEVTAATMSIVARHYREIITDALRPCAARWTCCAGLMPQAR